MNRPQNLLYGADDTPNFLTQLLFAVQHATLMGIPLLFTVLVTNAAKVNAVQAASVISATLIASVIGTFIMSNKRFGAGRLLPLSSNPVYLAPSLLAASIGGLPMVFAMTLFSGVLQLVFTWVLKRLKNLFPAEIVGVVLTLVGFELGIMGIKYLLIHNQSDLIPGNPHLYVSLGVCTLILLYILTVWGKEFLRLYALIIAYILGYLAIYFLTGINSTSISAIHHARWLFLPHFNITHYEFNKSLVTPFLVAALVCICKVMGSISALQRMEDTEWSEPDMKNISRANLADSIATIFAGILGGTGLNVSSNSTALNLETKVASRKIGYFACILLLALAFSQKIALLLIYTPKPILGAILIFMGTSIIISGLKSLTPHINDTRAILVIGTSFLLGFSYSVFPDYYEHLPSFARSFSGSMIALATIIGIILNGLLRYHSRRHISHS